MSKLWGVGLGPGDPELVTVKAARVIGEADVIAFHSARHGRSISRAIAAPYMRPGQLEEHLVYPVTTETTDHPGGYQGAIDEFYERAAALLAEHLAAGRTVALLAAGDPLFYSSFMHMHRRLADRFDTEIIPGVTSVSAASAALGTPLVEGDQVLTVLPGTLPAEELTRRLRETDAAAIMKLGRTYPGVRQSLSDSGRLADAYYVERASSTRQRVLRAADVDDADVPYFAITLVPGPAPATRIPLTTPDAAADSAPAASNPVRAQARSVGELVVVGLGPGDEGWTTPEVARALAEATDIVGYTTYVNRVPVRAGQRRHASDNRVESERAGMALDMAKGGAKVAVVSSGDPGVFAMAAAVIEESADPQWREVPVRVLPGVTAASAVASRMGAPLGHDFAMISLSDRLKPWETVAQRISAVASADMAFAVYNPASSQRRWQVAAMRELVLEHRKPETPVVIGRDVGGPTESVRVVTLAELDPAEVDMRTLLIVGASTTTVFDAAGGPRVFTSRRYGD
ncbi:precorrin-3B C(17)-methyltransferase [Nocardia seriolae]|uniref:precorrin-3B C(17)-methyltransferase n=1 Tax=Nocardia seriolae TaxID=37332 RepID=UPI00051A2976|nr:precorrin-3B C(17)-methyltransferase [Nocardia seriolae]MTJ63969.1 precorrin-3B C(17)-methyltransferase [Nocardia seriolae]MTJ70985.1 precorrin-3B C(17)-methyltransferase [Nocardia seriolae]MTJ88693.1 precorrin-3B C(17)-methyltransferase [Nocardia seriolae]MTK32674.1 precorrin-3B C(17)-methyltransferase [Nocardia seriolae]MTK41856.1 precorrin-3B C(17)-methyltransferase [Nocardia seriolae]